MKFSRMLARWPASLVFRSPYTCNIKVTQRCNLKCSFCGLWKHTGIPELSVSDYELVADKLKKMGLARVVITGGEPFLRPDLVDIIATFAQRNFSVTLLTNGTLVTREKLVRLREAGLHDLGISLDTLDSRQQDDICGVPGVTRKAIAAIRTGVEVLHHGIVEVLVTVGAFNLTQIPELVHFITTDLNAWAVINPVNIPASENAILSQTSDNNVPPLEASAVDNTYNALRKMKRNGAGILVSDVFLEASRQYLKTGKYAWRCDAGLRYFTIFSDGSLAPCSDTAPIANIMAMKPSDIRKPEFIQAARSARQRCRGCIFSCWRESTYLFTQPSVWIERAAFALKSGFRRGQK